MNLNANYASTGVDKSTRNQSDMIRTSNVPPGVPVRKNSSIRKMTTLFPPTFYASCYQLQGSGLDLTLKTELGSLGNDKKVAETARIIRHAISSAPLPSDLETTICAFYNQLCENDEDDDLTLAVKTLAKTEDYSIAHRQEAYVNVCDDHDLLEACRDSYASIFTDKLIIQLYELGQKSNISVSINIVPLKTSTIWMLLTP